MLTAGLFALMAVRFEKLIQLAAYLVLGAGCIALSAIDFDTKTLPTRLVYFTAIVGGLLFGVASIADNDPSQLVHAAISAAIVAILFFITWFIAPNGMGFGDVRFVGTLAMFLGWLGFGYVFIGITLAFVSGAAVGIAMMIIGRAGRKSAIPFGPFLAFGAVTAILVGQPIILVASGRLPSAG